MLTFAVGSSLAGSRGLRSGGKCRNRKAGSGELRKGVNRVVCMAEPSSPAGFAAGEEENLSVEVQYEEEIVMESESSVQRRKMLAIMFGILNLFHLFASFTSMIAPLVPETFFGVTKSSIERSLMRFWGAEGLLRISTLISLKTAAEKNRMESATYRRMSFALAFSSLFAAASVLLSGLPAFSAHFTAFSLLNIFTGIMALWYWLASPGTGPLMLLVGTVEDAAGILNARKLESKAFGALAVISFLVFVAGVLKPAAFMSLVYQAGTSPTTAVVLRGFLSTFALQAAALATLKDASERDRLGASTFTNLNTGIAGGSILLYVASLGALRGKPSLGAIVFTGFIIVTGVITTNNFIKFKRRGKDGGN